MKIEKIKYIEISNYEKFDFGTNTNTKNYLNGFDTLGNYQFKNDCPIIFGHPLNAKEKDRESRYLKQLNDKLFNAEKEIVLYYGRNFSNIFVGNASRRRANMDAFLHARFYDIEPIVYKITVEKGDLFYPVDNCADSYQVFLGIKPQDLKINLEKDSWEIIYGNYKT